LRTTLCRCGQSKNKPYCDLSHIAAGFDASGEAVTRPSPLLDQRDGPLVVTPLRDGPLDLRGSAEVVTGTGRTIDRTVSVRLCRCGHSNDKPFCDGSHREAGFCADGRGVAPVCKQS
jgi:CDGSH-type Zn-finger protein